MRMLEYLLSKPLLASRESVETALSIVTRENQPNWQAVQAKQSPSPAWAEMAQTRDGVAILPIIGPIFRYSDWFTELCGGVTVDALARDLTAAIEDSNTKSILLAFDSPGGEATGIAELADAIRAASEKKPVVAYAGDDACSAAYWLASAASKIVVSPTAMLGSIGVYILYPKPGQDYRSVEIVSSQSPAKRPDVTTLEGKAEIQRIADDLAEVFISAVAVNRGVSPDEVVSEFGRGGVLVGQKAVDAGMADEVGSFESVLADLARGAYPPRTAAKSRRPTPSSASSSGVSVMKSFFAKFTEKPNGTCTVEPVADSEVSERPVIVQAAPLKELKTDGNQAELDQLKATVADQQKALAAMKAQSAAESASAFAAEMLSAKKIIPAERKALEAALTQAKLDDYASPLAATETSRVAMLQSLYTDRVAHTLTQERIDASKTAEATNRTIANQQSSKGSPSDQGDEGIGVNDVLSALIANGRVSADMLK